MVDYKISINNGSFEQNYEFRKLDYTFQWDLYLSQINLNSLQLKDVKSPYSVKLIEDGDFVGYELYKGDNPIKLFEFRIGGFGNISNLLEVTTYILRNS